MKKISLSQGKNAIVDDEDFDYLNQWKWYAREDYQAFYASRNLRMGNGKRKTISIHNILMGKKRGKVIDHINNNGLDNRKENLRFCTNRENTWNQRKKYGQSSRFKGVSWSSLKKLWIVQITLNGKVIKLAECKNERKAGKIYDTYATKMFGKFALINYAK